MKSEGGMGVDCVKAESARAAAARGLGRGAAAAVVATSVGGGEKAGWRAACIHRMNRIGTGRNGDASSRDRIRGSTMNHRALCVGGARQLATALTGAAAAAAAAAAVAAVQVGVEAAVAMEGRNRRRRRSGKTCMRSVGSGCACTCDHTTRSMR